MSNHFQQRMSWLPQRWRTQRNAIRHANCKIQWVIKTLNASCTSSEVCLLECLFYPHQCFIVFDANVWRRLSRDISFPDTSRCKTELVYDECTGTKSLCVWCQVVGLVIFTDRFFPHRLVWRNWNVIIMLWEKCDNGRMKFITLHPHKLESDLQSGKITRWI